MKICLLLVAFWLIDGVPSPAPTYDYIIRNAVIYDGSGAAPTKGDVAIKGDKIVAIGKLTKEKSRQELDAKGLALAPGFINMLSWANISLIADGRSMGNIKQGVTLEVMGEGSSMGPLNSRMKERLLKEQGDIRYDIRWTTLAEYLQYLEKKGVSTNVASYIGAATIREYVLGLEKVQPTPAQLEQMRQLVRQEMAAGALGIGSSLIYIPGNFASTEELIALCQEAVRYQGKYISHIRDEDDELLEAIRELIRISREAKIPAEIYHLKASGEANWGKMDEVLASIEAARKEGLKITADMYTYPASSTGLDTRIPIWAREGGYEALFSRLQDQATRTKMLSEMAARPSLSPEKVLLVGFRNEQLKPLTGKTLAEVAKARNQSADEAVLDLILEDRSRIQSVFFSMSEDNIRKQIRYPWVSLGSDASSMATEGVFLKSSTHPRAYGNFVRLLGKYVREDQVLTLQEAVRRLSGLPATNLGLDRRGFIRKGYFADLVLFDPANVADKATFEKPHQYAVGVQHVFVNGVPVLKDGEHTGATPGRAVYGPGKVRK